MYARVGTGQAQPDKIEEGTRNVKENVVPVLKQQKGFKHFYSMVDRATGKVYTISMWASEADMKAFVGSGL